MVLSNQKEIVLNELLVAVKGSVERYDQAAAAVDDAPVSTVFRQLAADRRNMADSVENILKGAGWLPAEPDPDRQSLSELATRIKTALPGDNRSMLIETAENIEKEIETHLRNAMALDLPEGAARRLAQFEVRLDSDRKKIRALRSKLSE